MQKNFDKPNRELKHSKPSFYNKIILLPQFEDFQKKCFPQFVPIVIPNLCKNHKIDFLGKQAEKRKKIEHHESDPEGYMTGSRRLFCE